MRAQATDSTLNSTYWSVQIQYRRADINQRVPTSTATSRHQVSVRSLYEACTRYICSVLCGIRSGKEDIGFQEKVVVCVGCVGCVECVESCRERQGAAESDREQHRATESGRERQRAAESDIEQQRATESGRERQRAAESDREQQSATESGRDGDGKLGKRCSSLRHRHESATSPAPNNVRGMWPEHFQ